METFGGGTTCRSSFIRGTNEEASDRGALPLMLLLIPLVTDRLGESPGCVVDGANGLAPFIRLLIGVERAAIGGADKIEVSDGDEWAVDDGWLGDDFLAVISDAFCS